jgi:uncharacterized protein
MFVTFFLALRDAKVPVTLREYLTLLEAVRAGVADFDVEGFYFVARATLVKDERWFDRFDRVFADHFGGLAAGIGVVPKELPEEWLRRLSERVLTEEEKALVQALGGWDKLMEELAKRLAEQKERHEGGSKWIGTGGTSPFGAFGYNPQGVRIGQGSSRHRSAVAVWDRREFQDLDDDVELGVRGMKMALRRLREFVREGAPDELDVDATIDATARNAGLLDLKMRPERRNRARVLLFLDVGGSMDDHVASASQLFSAARAEFAGLEHFYFHNCVYDRVWRSNADRVVDVIPTEQVLRTYGRNWKLVVVGDASMSPYELTVPGASIEHVNAESGEAWLRRLVDHYPRAAWINPTPEPRWGWTETIGAIRGLFGGRMYPLTLAGLGRAMSDLAGRRRVVGAVLAALAFASLLGVPRTAARAEDDAAVVAKSTAAERTRLRALCDAGELDALLAACDTTLRTEPGAEAALEFRAWTLHATLRFDEAREAYLTLVEKVPGSAWGWASLARLDADLGRFGDAAAHAERALALAPRLAVAWNELVRGLRGTRDVAAARQALGRAKGQVPEDWRLLHAARLEWFAGDHSAAAALLGEAAGAQADAAAVAHLRRLVDADASLTPEVRERREHGETWMIRAGRLAIESRVGPALPEDARKVVDAAAATFPRILGVPATGPDVRVVLSRTVEEHEEHRRALLPQATVGTPFTTRDAAVYVAWERASFTTSFAHELAHALLHARPVNPVPWVHEGVAGYLEIVPAQGTPGGIHANALAVLTAARDAQRLPPWAELSALVVDDFAGPASHLHYARTWLVVHWALHGEDAPGTAGFHRLLDCQDAAAVPRVLGKATWTDLAAALDAHLARLSAPVAAAEPAPAQGPWTVDTLPDTLAELGRYELAVQSAERRVAREPLSPATWAILVETRCALGQYAEARDAVRRARAAGVDATACALWSTRTAWAEGDIDAALSGYRECERLGVPDDIAAMFVRLIEVESELSPDIRATRDPKAPWRIRKGFFDVETTVAPWLPEETERVMVHVAAELPGLVGISEPGAIVEVVLSRTRLEHLARWRESHSLGGSVRTAFAQLPAPGRSRCYVAWDAPGFETSLAHELTHAFLHLRAPRAPNWLHEGLALHAESIARPGGNFDRWLPLLAAARDEERLLPWKEVAGLRGGRFAAHDCLREYAQAWVAVHWMLTGRDGPGRVAVARVIRASNEGKEPAEAFRAAVGRPWEQIEASLDAHLGRLLDAAK